MKVYEGREQGVSYVLDMKGPAYDKDRPLHGTIQTKTISTAKDGGDSPSDPTYFKVTEGAQFVGAAFGCANASVKVSQPSQAAKIAFWGRTDFTSGDVFIPGGSGDTSEGYACETKAMNFVDRTYNSDGTVKAGGTVAFGCRHKTATEDEALRLYNLLLECIADGYKIVITNGTWYADGSSEDLWQGDINVSNRPDAGSVSQITPSPLGVQFGFRSALSPDWSIVWFSVTDKNGNSLYQEGLDPKTIEIYAVPQNVGICENQVIFRGAEVGENTVRISGAVKLLSGNTVLSPAQTTNGGYVSSENIPFSLLEDVASSDHTRAPVGGNTANVKTSTSAPWLEGDGDIHFSFTVDLDPSTTQGSQWMAARHGINGVNADVFCADMTYKVTYEFINRNSLGGVSFIEVTPAFGDAVTKHVIVPTTPNTTITGEFEVTAKKDLQHPLWTSSDTSLSGINAHDSPKLTVKVSQGFPTVTISIREVFIWAFRYISLGGFYASVYPYWTERRFAGLSGDSAGKILAPDAGIGSIASDGMISWVARDANDRSFGVSSVWDSANSQWVAIFLTNNNAGGASQEALSTSSDGESWSVVAQSDASAGEYFGRVFALGGKVIVLCEQTALGACIRSGTSAATIGSPVDLPSGITSICAMAYDGTRWWVFGGAGGSAYSSDLSTFTFVATPWDYVIFDAKFVSGKIYVCGPNGKVAYTTPTNALSGEWTIETIDSLYENFSIESDGTSPVVCSCDSAWIKVGSAAWRRVFQRENPSIDFSNYAQIVRDAVSGVWVVATGASDGSWRNLWTTTDDLATTTPRWNPHTSNIPSQAAAQIIYREINSGSANPVMVSNEVLGGSGAPSFALAVNPPDSSEGATSGETTQSVLHKICQEWRLFATETSVDPATIIDGSSDVVEIELPDISTSAIEDIATIITVSYRSFSGSYLGKAYTQNVDEEYVPGNDAHYFGGWDESGNANGLAIWTICRNAYLATGSKKSYSQSFDSVQDAETIGRLFLSEHPDLGSRIASICRGNRFLKVSAKGNESSAAIAHLGNRYKPNPTILAAQGVPIGETGAGVVVEENHNYGSGEHDLTIALAPLEG